MRLAHPTRLLVGPVCVLVFGFLSAGPLNAQEQPKGKYVGIEISSTAVRAVMIEYKADGSVSPVSLGPLEGLETRTNLINSAIPKDPSSKVKIYPPAVLKQVVSAIKEFYETLSKAHKLEADRFFVVASSGAKGGGANFGELAALLKESVGSLPPLDDTITAQDELRYGITGALPPESLAASINIDIGSGNTKIGFFIRGQDGKYTQHVEELKNLGTRALQQKADAIAKEKNIKFEEAAEEIRIKELLPRLKEAVESLRKNDDARGRDQVYVLGGAAWAMATLTFPSYVGQKTVAISYGNVKDYKQNLLLDNKKPFGGLPKEKARLDKLNSELEKVEAAFTPAQLLAGAILLDSIFEALELSQQGKSITFVNALFAWPMKYVEERSGGRVKPIAASAEQVANLTRVLKVLQEDSKAALALNESQQVSIKVLGEQIKALKEQQAASSDVKALAISVAGLAADLKFVTDKLRLVNANNGSLEKLLNELNNKLVQLDQRIKKLFDTDFSSPIRKISDDFAKAKIELATLAADVGGLERKVVAFEGKNELSPIRDLVAGGKMVGDRARITILFPKGAMLFVDERYCPSTLGSWSFVTPPLAINTRYYYTLKIEVMRNGQLFTASERVFFEGGGEAKADLTRLITSN